MKIQATLFCIVFLLLGSGPIMQPSQASAEDLLKLGEKLFNDPALAGSTNDRSCATCHPNRKGLEKVKADGSLIPTINRCIIGALKGEKLERDSLQMLALRQYILDGAEGEK